MNILIADDHGLFRAGLSDILRRDFPEATVTEAPDLAQALALVRDADCDLVLLDAVMPGMSGAQSVGELVALLPTTPVVVVSALEDPITIQRIMEAGAAGFISKSVDHDRFIATLREILETGVPLTATAEPSLPGGVHLSPRQREIMGHIRDGLSNQQIAERLGISGGTVKIHVSSILRALGASNRTEAVALWFGRQGI